MENWPLPPFYKDVRTSPEQAPVEAVIFAPQGKVLGGRLLGFLPESLTVELAAHDDGTRQSIPFAHFNSIQLIHPITLVPDTELLELYREAGDQMTAPGLRPFHVYFVDGEQLQGQTKGFVRTSRGLFIFLSTGTERVVRIFIPENALASYQVGGLRVATDLADDGIHDARTLTQKISTLHGFTTVRLGDILANQGLVSRDQMFEALRRMKRDKHQRLSTVLVDMEALSRAKLTQAVAEQLNIPRVSLRDFVIEPGAISLVPKAFASDHQVLPLLATDRSLVVALETPLDADYLDELRFSAQRQIVPLLAHPAELSARIAAEYSLTTETSESASLKDEIEQLTQNASAASESPEGVGANRQVSANDTLLVRLVNKMIVDAHKAGASDIHIEAYPEEQTTRIRFRIDGILSDYLLLPHTLRAAMISRVKIMADLDISEHRKPQDGKIDFSRFAPLKLELRVASLPTTNGLEDIVMRLLASAAPIPVDQLGLRSELVSQLKAMVHRSYGLILVCGPTGSGKTTTLHSLLEEVNTPENKIWTAEDPIEITHPGLRQIQMIPRAGLTFATAMRAFLRADPDIIMVGEMRDAETTHIAIEASLTGHLVLSTLHTNSAPESVVRLLDMGLDPFSFSDALIGVLSQRLARRLCPHCKTPAEDAPEELHQMAQAYCDGTPLDVESVLAEWHTRYGAPAGQAPVLYRATGCAHCNQTGHKGRVGIYELMAATPAIKKLIQSRAPVPLLFQCALADGMLTLKQYGLIKVLEGVTDTHSVYSACT
ncbi:MAG: ATPase, T2SS/T4P/T4SS family [Rhodoferax sp.]|nr:ATPase, T2SS/T4P/T4SS family [Rhodoferax sp.]